MNTFKQISGKPYDDEYEEYGDDYFGYDDNDESTESAETVTSQYNITTPKPLTTTHKLTTQGIKLIKFMNLIVACIIRIRQRLRLCIPNNKGNFRNKFHKSDSNIFQKSKKHHFAQRNANVRYHLIM